MKNDHPLARILGLVALACVALAVMIGADASAQFQAGKLRGTVFDDQGAVLPGVTVTLSGNAAPQTKVTDAQGRFRFLGLDPGAYHLAAELEGFSGRDRSVDVSIGRTTTVKLTLNPIAEDPRQVE